MDKHGKNNKKVEIIWVTILHFRNIHNIPLTKVGDPISWVVSGSWWYSNSTFHDLGKTNSLNTTLHQLHINPQNPKPDENGVSSPGKPVISPFSSNFTHENQLVSCLYRNEIPWLGFQNSSFCTSWRKETSLGALVSYQTTFCYSITPTNSPKNFRQASFRTASTALAALCHINHESEFLACCSLSCQLYLGFYWNMLACMCGSAEPQASTF